MSAAKRLDTRTVEKVWGRDTLPAPFAAPAGKRIGEIWFEPDPALPDLLVKYLFTSDKLSVQVHPSDAEAPGGSRGKEECWLVLDAEPGASLAIGFREEIDADIMRAAALDGSIEHMLAWHKAKPGDFFYLPAGTVHAIGPGLGLIEVQQNADITYRLYDYGRPRELHLDAALAVAEGGPHDPALRRSIDLAHAARLVDGPHFRLDYLAGPPSPEIAARYNGPVLVMPLAGTVQAKEITLEAGECGQVASLADAAFSEGSRALLAQPL